MRSVLSRWFCALLTLGIGLTLNARADAPSAPIPVAIGKAVVTLNGPWRFHTGDDLNWAHPDFDDSAWAPMDLTAPAGSSDPNNGSSGFVSGWTAKGYPKLIGYAWYRLSLDITNPAGADERLAIRMPLSVDDAYQVYVNGQLLGEFGRFTANHVTFINAQPRAFPLPDSVRSGPVTIAIRMWLDAGTPLISPDAGGLHSPPLLGQAQVIESMLQLAWDDMDRSQARVFLQLPVFGLMVLLGLFLFRADRRERCYLWMSLACLTDVFYMLISLFGSYTTSLPMAAENFLLDVVLSPLIFALWVLFWGHWFGLTEMRRIHAAAWSLFLLLILSVAPMRAPLFGSLVPVSAASFLVPATVFLKLCFGAVIVWIVYRGIRLRGSEGWLGLPAIVLLPIWLYADELSTVHLYRNVSVAGFVFGPTFVARLLMLGAIVVLMMRRFLRGMRQKQYMEVELEQARTVQQVLIPEALPQITGFEIESEYRPAQQVGGDFFQILPLEAGGFLAIIGDVSGKGMPAAMTVSLLVGTVRTLARFTTSPAEILAAMNIRMLGRSQGGFTTCLVVRVDANGACAAANAGHLAPYLNGREMAVAGGLPLGLSATASYAETSFQLATGERLTLITDGVVEARTKEGELFGFERAAAIAGQPARAIARTAEQFGHDDDITVLGVLRLAAEPVAIAQLPELSPAPA